MFMSQVVCAVREHVFVRLFACSSAGTLQHFVSIVGGVCVIINSCVML